jgi:hypothetical protein
MIALAFAARLPCETMTPLGLDVLPDVNCKKARSAGPMSRSISPAAGAAAISSAPALGSAKSARAASGASMPDMTDLNPFTMSLAPDTSTTRDRFARYASSRAIVCGG